MEITPGLLSAGAKVIDLSAAFRLRTPEFHKRWYKHEHTESALLAEAAYGLPEFSISQTSAAYPVALAKVSGFVV